MTVAGGGMPTLGPTGRACRGPDLENVMDILDTLLSRHTAKAYQADRPLTDEQLDAVRSLLRFSPSSTNVQPWHFVLATTAEGKARVADGATGPFPFNRQPILDASAVVVFCAKTTVDDAHLEKVLDQEDADGRFAEPALKERNGAGRRFFVDIHRVERDDLRDWVEKQVYLNVGNFLLGVAALGLDATPMEGVDTEGLDAALGLTDRGLASVVVVPIGYADERNDWNAPLPKSRLPVEAVFTEL